MKTENKYGHYEDGGKTFVITTPDIPRNWYNFSWNEDYVSMFSQVGYGESIAQGEWGQRTSPVTNRSVYIIDGEDFWFAGAVPDGMKKYDYYRCEHHRGYTKIITEKNSVRSELTFFVPRKGQFELWALELTNTSDKAKDIKVIGYASTDMDGAYRFQGYNTSQSYFDKSCGAIMLRADMPLRRKGVNERYYGYLTADTVNRYDCAHTAFIGTYGSVILPRAVQNGGCTNGECFAEKACFAIQKNIHLDGGKKGYAVFNAGVALSCDEINENKKRFDTLEKITAERDAVVCEREAQADGVHIRTPLEMLDNLFEWLKYGDIMGARWARVRSNGFRDITSDSECLAVFNPEKGLERLSYILSFQYSNGYAPRRIKDGAVQDSNFSDNAVWMIFAARTLLREFGNTDFLMREIPFNDGTSATLYEHCKRALVFLYNFRGANGMIKIWGGDWNDTMEWAGTEGKGESVWLTIAFCRAALEFSQIASEMGLAEDEKLALGMRADMIAKVEKFGWDGEYYITAIDDNGRKIGSHESEEAKIFANPNLWAVWADIGSRAESAYNKMEELLDTKIGLCVSAPPLTHRDAKIGGMSCKAPGVHENGGMYLHVSAWKIITDSILKRPESAQRVLYSMLPFTNEVVDGRAEPYILFNSYFPEICGYRYGTPGQSWKTAAGSCLIKSIVCNIFGLTGEREGLRLVPCIPPLWDKCSISKDFRGAHYDIEYIGGGCDIESVSVDGCEISGDLLPFENGKTYKVTVTMKKI